MGRKLFLDIIYFGSHFKENEATQVEFIEYAILSTFFVLDSRWRDNESE